MSLIWEVISVFAIMSILSWSVARLPMIWTILLWTFTSWYKGKLLIKTSHTPDFMSTSRCGWAAVRESTKESASPAAGPCDEMMLDMVSNPPFFITAGNSPNFASDTRDDTHARRPRKRLVVEGANFQSTARLQMTFVPSFLTISFAPIPLPYEHMRERRTAASICAL